MPHPGRFAACEMRGLFRARVLAGPVAGPVRETKREIDRWARFADA